MKCEVGGDLVAAARGAHQRRVGERGEAIDGVAAGEPLGLR